MTYPNTTEKLLVYRTTSDFNEVLVAEILPDGTVNGTSGAATRFRDINDRYIAQGVTFSDWAELIYTTIEARHNNGYWRTERAPYP